MAVCRFCNHDLDSVLIDLGEQPPSNSYLTTADAAENVYPLKVMVCGHCRLTQLDTTVDPGEIFNHDYAYFSSFSPSWVAHAKAYAEEMTKRFGLDGSSRVVEVASNDGYLLQHFVGAGIPVLGVEPSASVAAAARKRGVETREAFFNAETARILKDEGSAADLIAANNVLAHVPDINGFVAGFAILLKPNGVLTVEFPHLLNLLEQNQFDTIYHEHYFYLSLLVVEKVFAAHGLRVFDVQELPTHGGSLRVFACRKDADAHTPGEALAKVRAREVHFGIEDGRAYAGFQQKAETVRADLQAFFAQAQQQGKTVAGYGAAAKGNTLLNYCGMDAGDLDFVADANDWKQGRYLPGSRIPILAPEHIRDAKPDYVLILPWNLRGELSEQLAYIRDWGGKFVVAIPRLEVW